MARSTCRSRRWVSAKVAAVALAVSCGPGTPAPPFRSLAAADSAQLQAACDSGHFDLRYARVAEVAAGVTAVIIPESLSYRNRKQDYSPTGRVVAKIQLLHSGGYEQFKMEDNPGCLYIYGKFKEDSLFTAVISQGKILVDSIKTRARFGLHLLHAEAHWESIADTTPSTGALGLGPGELYAEARDEGARTRAYLRALQRAVVAYSQTSCTNHSCCIQSGGHVGVLPVRVR
jgi:hypothetical protein